MLSPFAPKILVSRDSFSRPAPVSLLILHTFKLNLVHGIPPAFRDHFFLRLVFPQPLLLVCSVADTCDTESIGGGVVVYWSSLSISYATVCYGIRHARVWAASSVHDGNCGI